jgi:hypothetical protein
MPVGRRRLIAALVQSIDVEGRLSIRPTIRTPAVQLEGGTVDRGWHNPKHFRLGSFGLS